MVVPENPFKRPPKVVQAELPSIKPARKEVAQLLAGHTEGCVFYLLARGRNFAGNTWVAHHAINLDAEPLRARRSRAPSRSSSTDAATPGWLL